MKPKIHFISIGGSVMHNLAITLHLNGMHVTGSDDEIYDPARARLAKYGILPDNGWDEKKITKDLDYVIIGMHAKADNPELRKARELNLPIYSFPEFMYQQTVHKTRVVVAGSHGKTTLTSMLLHLFKYWNRKANFLVGAQLEGFETMVNLDEDADTAIFEGDEYLASPLEPIPKFLFYQPHIAIITGIAWDHINAFPTYDSYLEQFRKFIQSVDEEGVLIYNEEDEALRQLIATTTFPAHAIPYRTPPHHPDGSKLIIDTDEGAITLPMMGTHNAANFEGARKIAKRLKFSHEEIKEAMAHFSSPGKRLEIIAEQEQYTIINDFAHAPSKVAASVKAVRQHFPRHELVAVLELHTFSSLTPDFLPYYKNTLNAADQAYIYLNPHAVAKKGSGVNADMVKTAFQYDELKVSSDLASIKSSIRKKLRLPVVFLLMSSGNWGGEDWHDLPTFVASRQKENQ